MKIQSHFHLFLLHVPIQASNHAASLNDLHSTSTWAGRYQNSKPFWILMQQEMLEMVVQTRSLTRAQLQSDHHHQNANIQFFTGQMPFLLPSQQCQSTEGKGI